MKVRKIPYNGLISVYAKCSALIPHKSKGVGAASPLFLVISGGVLRVGKISFWPKKVGGRGVVNDVFVKYPLYRDFN